MQLYFESNPSVTVSGFFKVLVHNVCFNGSAKLCDEIYKTQSVLHVFY